MHLHHMGHMTWCNLIWKLDHYTQKNELHQICSREKMMQINAKLGGITQVD